MITHPLKVEELAIYSELLAIVEILVNYYKKTQNEAFLPEIEHFYALAEEYKQKIDITSYPQKPACKLDFHQ